MASVQGWKDFDQFTSMIELAKQNIIEINNTVNRLKHDKQEIMDDTERLAEITEIIGIHPLYTVPQLQAQFQKAVDLQAFLVNNGYIT